MRTRESCECCEAYCETANIRIFAENSRHLHDSHIRIGLKTKNRRLASAIFIYSYIFVFLLFCIFAFIKSFN